MITISNFNDAYLLYQQGLIAYRLLQEQAIVLISLLTNPPPEITSPLSITHQHMQWLTQQSESTMTYMDMLGGDMHICEEASYLQQIKGYDLEWAETHDGNWPNVMDMPLSWDVCCYLDEPEVNPQWVMFLLCWNNAGGPVYYVPKHLWEMARVAEHIAKTANQ